MGDLEVRRLGCSEIQAKSMGLGGAWWSTAGSENDCIEAIHRALDFGINYLDTYPELEPWWGKALSGGRRKDVYLQAKITSHGPDENTVDYSAEQTRRSVEASLQRLKTDYLDNVLIHGFGEPDDEEYQRGNVDPLAPGNALDELTKLKEEGKIRHIGMGARNIDVLLRAIDTGQVEIVLTYLEYNLFNQTASAELFPAVNKRDVGVLLASPLGMGLLTGDETVFERASQYSDNAINPQRVATARAMWEWCRQRDLNIRHLAIQYCMAAPVQGVVLPGPATTQQLIEAYEAATADISCEVWDQFHAEFGVGIVK